MLRNIFLLLFTLVLIEGRGSPDDCSKGCNCVGTSATCDTFIFEPFPEKILTLNIINPKQPLIPKQQLFNVTGLRSINYLTINNATILGLDKTHFTDLPSLYTVTITNSKINLIDPLTFSKTNVKQLKIINSTLTSFDKISSDSLEEIDLSGCHLKTITKTSFATLSNLSYLNLANNQIQEVDPHAFANLYYLQEIKLSSNKITKLHPDIFSNNQDLETLDLSDNPIDGVNIHIFAELEKLVLNSLHLKEFGRGLNKTISLLSYLDLAHNNLDLAKIPFANMPQLEYIDLSSNNLTTLDPKVFYHNEEIQKLILNNNNFGKFPKLVSSYSNFDTSFLSCKNCQITSIPDDSFKDFRALIILYLADNQLATLDHWLWNLPNLIDLDLSHNNIQSISSLAFVNSTSLATINLSHNPIVRISTRLFINNKVLNTLDLSFCMLNELWTDHTINLTALRVLNLEHNSLSAIKPNQLAVTPALTILILSNNTLTCDDNFRDSMLWLNQHRVSSSHNSWKRSEELQRDAALFDEITPWNWKELAKQFCTEQYYIKNFEHTEIELEILSPEKIELKSTPVEMYIDDSDDFDYDTNSYNDHDLSNNHENKVEIDLSDLALQSIHFKSEKHAHYSVLWLSLVFIFTALTVLVIVANVLLILVRSKMIPREVNLPHIKIPRWGNGTKLKKHSGSVYRPLSEERSEMLTPIIIRKDHVPTHVSQTKPTV